MCLLTYLRFHSDLSFIIRFYISYNIDWMGLTLLAAHDFIYTYMHCYVITQYKFICPIHPTSPFVESVMGMHGPLWWGIFKPNPVSILSQKLYFSLSVLKIIRLNSINVIYFKYFFCRNMIRWSASVGLSWAGVRSSESPSPEPWFETRRSCSSTRLPPHWTPRVNLSSSPPSIRWNKIFWWSEL